MEWMEEDELLRSRLRGGARGSGYGHLCEENKNCRTLTTLFCKISVCSDQFLVSKHGPKLNAVFTYDLLS